MDKKRQTRIRKFPVRKINRQISRKLVGLFLVVILALIALLIKITQINITNGADYTRIVLQNNQQQYVNRTLAFKRGDILDRNGTVLATSERVYNLVLDCSVVNYEETDTNGNTSKPYVEATVSALVNYFDLDEEDIYNRLNSDETKNSQYQILKKNVTMEEKEAFETATSLTDESLTDEEYQERYNVQGVWFEESYQRVYPQNSIACDLIGFTGSSNQADWGIEGYYNDELNGTNGRTFGYYNSDSTVEQNIIQPIDGNNVISTCDVNIQQIIRNAIQDFQNKYSEGPNNTNGASNIAVLVMDPNNGEILGMDSSDWYDLNNPRDLSGIVDEETLASMTEEEKVEKLNSIWRNYCISDAFEPGSTAKPFTVAAGLETDTVKMTDTYVCDGYETINGQIIRCSVYPDAHGEMDTAGSLVNSCNDALMQISYKLGAENFLKYQSIFNFGEKTGIDLPGENTGILYSLDNMGTMELATSSFGQGFTCTMVQEAAAMSSLINGGYYYKPHVVKSITDSSGNLLENVEGVVERQTVSKEVSDYIRQTLGEVVSSGTGQSAKVPGYSMGGKTGTAQKIPRDSGNYLVSFIGFAPLDDPQVLVYVIVDEPNVEEQDSSLYAQEIAKQIFTELLPYMNIFADNPEELAAAQTQQETQSTDTQQETESQQTEESEGESQATENSDNQENLQEDGNEQTAELTQ